MMVRKILFVAVYSLSLIAGLEYFSYWFLGPEN